MAPKPPTLGAPRRSRVAPRSPLSSVTLTGMTPLDHPWPEPPAPATTIQVAPGIQWLRMPLPFQLNHINLWLLEDGPGWTIVDTGAGLPDTRALWDRLFAERLDGRPVTRVVV